MKMYTILDSNNRLAGGLSSTPFGGNKESILIEISRDHEAFSNPYIFKYENGEIVKDVAYEQELIEQEQEQQNRPSDDEMNAIAIMELTEKIMGGV